MHNLYELNSDQFFDRLRFPRYLCMDLPFDNPLKDCPSAEKDQFLINSREILQEVIEFGSMKGQERFIELIKNGYLTKAEFELQVSAEKGKNSYFICRSKFRKDIPIGAT